MKGAALSLALLGLPHFAQAESSTECSLLGTVVSSKQLTWCPCEGEFFCARLDVGPSTTLSPDVSSQADPIP